jgi:hypothetical protein
MLPRISEPARRAGFRPRFALRPVMDLASGINGNVRAAGTGTRGPSIVELRLSSALLGVKRSRNLTDGQGVENLTRDRDGLTEGFCGGDTQHRPGRRARWGANEGTPRSGGGQPGFGRGDDREWCSIIGQGSGGGGIRPSRLPEIVIQLVQKGGFRAPPHPYVPKPFVLVKSMA